MTFDRSWFLQLLLVSLLFGGSSGAAEPPRKKLIEVGWDIPNTADLRANWKEMERSAPFDGLHFHVVAISPKRERVDSLKLWDATPWEYSWFEKCVDDLKTCRFQKLTDNWLRVDATPGTIEWSDDDGWKHLANKFGICSRVARKGGVKGVCIDLEGYGVKSFRFDPDKKLTFAETGKLARRRGAGKRSRPGGDEGRRGGPGPRGLHRLGQHRQRVAALLPATRHHREHPLHEPAARRPVRPPAGLAPADRVT